MDAWAVRTSRPSEGPRGARPGLRGTASGCSPINQWLKSSLLERATPPRLLLRRELLHRGERRIDVRARLAELGHLDSPPRILA